MGDGKGTSRGRVIALAKTIKDQMGILSDLIDELESEDDWLTLEEVRSMIPGVKVNRLNRLTASGALETRKLSERKRLYRRSSLEAVFAKELKEAHGNR